MSDDIAGLVAGILADLPTAVDGNHEFEFTPESVPDLPDVLRTDQIVVKKGHRIVNGCWRCDLLSVNAPKQALRGLGLIAMSTLFFPEGRTVEIELLHPASDIKLVRGRAPSVDPFLVTRPISYSYFPSERDRHPWRGETPDAHDLPAFWLTDRGEDGGATEEDWNARDTIVGFGSALGTARLGELLLDIGNPAVSGDEYRLEGENGFLGVAPLSAEVAFWLPGSIGWDTRLGFG